MALSKDELKLEENYLENTSKEISNQIDVLGKEIHVKKVWFKSLKRLYKIKKSLI